MFRAASLTNLRELSTRITAGRRAKQKMTEEGAQALRSNVKKNSLCVCACLFLRLRLSVYVSVYLSACPSCLLVCLP